ncbi:hypothetical protein [Enterococcus sp. BWR-S5]|nr:hypothetical protein [Enterococcus sp. BWR-S5]MBL1227133.1 hypothetical protein [Enterococcus sp. BWR-S5]
MKTFDVYWNTGVGVAAYYSGCERGISAKNKEQALRIATIRVFVKDGI